MTPAALAAAALAFAFVGIAIPARAAEVDFNRDIRPILSDNCFFCHGPDADHRKADLRLDTREGIFEDHDGVRAVDPDAPEKSELLFRITEADEDERMPPLDSHKELTRAQVEMLERWVLAGAPYAEHWAFVPPALPNPPQPEAAAGWVRNPIDHFVLARLEAEGLQPAEEAPRETLIRRASLDLTGLPPTPEAVAAFVADGSPDSFEQLADRLLASPAFGERMALAWLDVARYGDSSVMHADGPRHMWPWRDWVIQAYNANMPFDQFTVEQLAGDLLPDATVQQKIASGFNRNHATSDEGGAFPEELRVGYVVDRVKTTANTWLALSMECAQCHDHKYDPISNREYYEFFAYFNNTADPGMQSRSGNQDPVVHFFTDPAKEDAHQEATSQLEATTQAIGAHREAAAPALEAWLELAAAQKDGALPEPDGLAHHFPIEADEAGAPTVIDGVTGQVAEAAAGALTAADRDGGTGLRFDPGSASAEFGGDPARLAGDSPFTFAAWVRTPNGQAASGAIFARMDVGSDHRGYDLWTQGGQVGTHIISKWPDDAVKVVSKERLKEDAWQHVAVTYDGSAKAAGVAIYIDGQPVETQVENDSLTGPIDTATALRIGSRSSGGVFNGSVDDIRIYTRDLAAAEIDRIGANSVGQLLAIPAADRSDEQRNTLTEHYFRTHDPTFAELESQRADLAQSVADLEAARSSSMVMSDLKDVRPTYILDRGAYDAPKEDETLAPGTPAVLPPLPDGAPADRLGLARWLVQPDHPLTSRVAVNRYWAMLFGSGLVKTVADFGAQGDMPSHPQLLDWLATDFVAHGWDIKRTLRQIVTSATYRQSSRHALAPDLPDPQNTLLARGPRFRLQGEIIRDQALALSGLLTPTIGGPSVRPYQPPGIWNEVSLDGGLRYEQDHGDALYRRSMYTYWKRSAPNPAMMAFDAPTRETCTVQRDRTNTPLQALVTLNDTQFVEAARALAERVLHQPEADRLRFAFRLVTARDPDAGEIDLLGRALADQLAHYTGDPDKATKLLSVGESPRDQSLDAVEHAAWTNVASILLNLDETLTKS
ncbi:DUF1553 domain-containing protein [soil metagenome]